jgi:putative hydrolase of the HAD superfamily
MSLRAVIFDYGNVLCLQPRPEDFEPLYRISGIDEACFQKAFWGHRLEYDRGTMDGAAYWGAIARDAAVSLTTEQANDLIAGDVGLWQRFNPALVRWNQSLRAARCKTAVLSNMPIDLARDLRRNANWLAQYDLAVFSAEIGLLKPEPEIYAHCLAGLKIRPEESLFIDDNAANVEGARAAGMNAIHFESAARLAADAAPFGLPQMTTT